MQLSYIIFLKNNLTYKKAFGAILLALYVFITTPVQVWHGHYHHSVTASKSVTLENQEAFTQQANDSIDASCNICDHHYSVYVDDAISIIQATLSNPLAEEANLISTIPSTPDFCFSNKGPPAAACAFS